MLSFVLLCLVPAALADYYKFTKAAPVTLVAAFGRNERYLVKMPCKGAWFKLFLSGKEPVGHIEIYGRTNGNIFCNDAGNKRWHNGEKTEFEMIDSVLKCDDDGYVHYRIKKDSNSISIMNYGNVLYTQNFDSSDGYCKTQKTSIIKTQVFVNDVVLYVDIDEVDYYKFTKAAPVTLVAAFGGNERYLVKMPCKGAWFKLFLSGKEPVGHIEIYGRTTGNIFCNGAGNKRWHNGAKTEFKMIDSNLKCDDDGYVHYRIQKDSNSISIMNYGNVLYTQNFDSSYGYCKTQETSVIKTQVFDSDSVLYVGIVEN